LISRTLCWRSEIHHSGTIAEAVGKLYSARLAAKPADSGSMEHMYFDIDKVYAEVNQASVTGKREESTPPGLTETAEQTSDGAVFAAIAKRVSDLSEKATLMQAKLDEKDQIISMLFAQLQSSQTLQPRAVPAQNGYAQRQSDEASSKAILKDIDNKLRAVMEVCHSYGDSLTDIRIMQDSILDKVNRAAPSPPIFAAQTVDAASVTTTANSVASGESSLPPLFALASAATTSGAADTPRFLADMDKFIRRNLSASDHQYQLIKKQLPDGTMVVPSYIGSNREDSFFPQNADKLLMMNYEQIKKFVAWYPLFQQDMKMHPNTRIDNAHRLGVARWKVYYWIEKQCGRGSSS
jgi:hypothetical protein